MKKLYYPIGHVAKVLEIETSKIRFWETVFGKLHSKSESGHKGDERRFTDLDIQRIRTIKALLTIKGFTLAGAKRELKELDFPVCE